MPDREETLLMELQAWGYVSAVAAAVVLLWYLLAGRKRKLLPAQRHRAVPWSGFEVYLAFFLYMFWPPICGQLLTTSGFLTWVYGSGFPWSSPAQGAGLGGAVAAAALAGPLPAATAAATAARAAQAGHVAARIAAWGGAAAFPFQLASILVLLRALRGTRLYQIGLTWWRAPANVVAGCIGALVLTPVVYGVYGAVVYLYTRWVGSPPQEHPLTLTLGDEPGLKGWALIFFDALLAAPLLEELLFRGVIQRWATSRPWGGTGVIVGTMAVSLMEWKLLASPAPALFVVAMLPGFFAVEFVAWRLIPVPNVARGIYATALLFAVAHAVWPTPIPLFILALGLGYLSYRTQSLVGPIVVHALFNGVTCVLLIISYLR